MSVHPFDIPLPPLQEPTWDKKHVPTASDLYAIRRSAKNSQSALAELALVRQSLKALQDQVETSESLHLKNLQAQLHRLNNANIIPRVTLREVFTWVVVMSPDDPHSPFTNAAPLLAITQVCRNWRETACDFPSLWSRIVIKPQRHVPLGTINLLTLFVTSSMHIPLALIVDLTRELSPKGPEDYDRIRQVIRIIWSQSFRWQRLELCLPSSLWMSDSIAFPIHAPFLEEVFILCESGSNSQPSEWIQSVFTESSAPRLRHVRLQHLTTAPKAFKDFLPWSILESVAILTPSDGEWRFGSTEALVILRNCLRLTSAHLVFHGCGDKLPPSGHMTIPSLRTFHYRALDGLLLEHLTAPNLAQLQVSQMRQPTDGQLASSFIARSPRLKSLILNGTTLDFLSLFPHMSLEHVVLQIYWPSDMLELANVLTYFHHSPPITLPQLHTLHIELNCSQSIDHESATVRVFTGILSVVVNRIHANSILRRVEVSIKRLSSAPETAQTILRRLQVLEMDGLHVTMG
ncbi:hypothetical protein DL96DRAFT_1743800 [Flagelloscypha sp. PMI_526]|nr:hypothetical protein DL96DRAFT_1743800 [Flagelloscypha sp. PMI_526]